MRQEIPAAYGEAKRQKARVELAVVDPDMLRLYTSFAEFERDERMRRGLPAAPTLPDLPAPKNAPSAVVKPPSTAIVPTPRPFVTLAKPKPTACISISHLTEESITALRAEGILEIRRATDTSVVFVRTRQRLHLLHATWVPDRQLDEYAVRLAVTWIEGHGLPSCAVAKNLGISEPVLRKALSAAGYERLDPARHAQLADARSARKPGKRGRLVRTSNAPGADAGA